MRQSVVIRLALVLVAAAPAVAHAQQVVGHVPLLPAAAGLNPLTPTQTVADPANPDVFVLHSRGLTALDRGAAPSFVNYEVGASGQSAPADLVFDAALRRVYVADASTDPAVRGIAVVDGLTRTVLARLNLPFAPSRLALDTTTRRLYAIEAAGPGVAAIDLATLAVTVATLPGQADAIAANPATGRLYLSRTTAGEVLVLNSDLSPWTTIPGVAMAAAIAVNPVANKVYVVRADGNVAIINAVTNAVIKTLAVVGAQFVVADVATGAAYVAGNDTNLTVVSAADTATTVPIAGTPAATAATGLALDSAGKRVFVGDLASLVRGRITVFSTATPPATRTASGFTGQPGAANLGWSVAKSLLYIANGNGSVSEFDPATQKTTSIVIGCGLLGGVVNDGPGVSFTLDTAAGRVAAVDVASTPTPSLLVSTAVGPLPLLSEISTTRNEVYVINEESRSLSVLDATTGALLRTKNGLNNEISAGFAVDHKLATPKGYITNPNLAAAAPNADYVTRYEPASTPADRLTGIDTCGLFPCVAGVGLGINETTHRLYISAVEVVLFPTPGANPAISIFNTQTDAYVKSVQVANSIPFPSFFLAVDEATNQVYVPVFSGTAWRVTAMKDTTTPTFTDIAVAGVPTAFSLAGGLLYVAEAASGQVEVIDTATNMVTRTIATGGRPASLLAQSAATDLLWVQNDGLANPSIQVYDALGLRTTLTDIAFVSAGLGIEHAFAVQTGGRLIATDNRHGTVAVVDPALGGTDMQITPSTLAVATTVAAYGTTLAQGGGTGPFLWEVTSGMLPPGLALDPSTGDITGTPTQQGIFSFLVRLTDNGQAPPRQDVEDFQIQVLDLRQITTSVPGSCGGSYDVTLLAAGGTPPYTWTSTGLPAGLTLDPASGRVSGTLAGALSCPADQFTVTVSDANAPTPTMVAQTYCIAAAAGGPPPDVDNSLRALKLMNDVQLEVAAVAPPSGGGFNHYRSTDEGATWVRLPVGATGTLPPSSLTAAFSDVGAVPMTPNLFWYRTVTVEACGMESAK